MPTRNNLIVRAGLFLTAALLLVGARPLLSQGGAAQLQTSSPLAASACPKYRGDLHNTGRATGRPLKAVQEWFFAANSIPFSSAVYDGDGIVFIYTDALHALDAETGEQKWEFGASLGGLGVATPILGANGLVYIACPQGLYAVNKRTGKAVWRCPTGTAGGATCAVGKDGTVYAYVSLRFIALDGKTGAKKWEVPAPNPHTNVAYISPSVTLGVQGTVVFGGKDQKVYALDCRTGNPRWVRDMGDQYLNMSSPAIGDDGTIYIGSQSGKAGRMNALDGDTGRILWQVDLPDSLVTSPALGDNGLLYLGNGDHNVYALDHKSGAVRWKFATGYWVQSSPAVGLDGTVYVGSCDHKLYALDGATGAKKWQYEAEDIILASPLITPDGALFYSTYNGAYHALPKSKQDQLAKEQAASAPDSQTPPG